MLQPILGNCSRGPFPVLDIDCIADASSVGLAAYILPLY